MQIRVHITSAILAATLGALTLSNAPVYAQLEGGTSLQEQGVTKYEGTMMNGSNPNLAQETFCPKKAQGDANCNGVLSFLEQVPTNPSMGAAAYMSAANYVVDAQSATSSFTDTSSVALRDIFTNVLTYRAASADTTKTLLDQVFSAHPALTSSLDKTTLYNTIVALSNLTTSGGGVPLTDYELWKKEFSGELHTKNADFNGDGVVNLTDYEDWRASAITSAMCTPPATGQVACVNAGGSWMQFANGCADSCGSSGKICSQAITMACECGAGMCWDGSKCVSGDSAGDGSGTPVEAPEKSPAASGTSGETTTTKTDAVLVNDGRGGTVAIPKDMIDRNSPSYNPVAANDYLHYGVPNGDSNIYEPKDPNQIIATRVGCDADGFCTVTRYTSSGAQEPITYPKDFLPDDIKAIVNVPGGGSVYFQGDAYNSGSNSFPKVDTTTPDVQTAANSVPPENYYNSAGEICKEGLLACMDKGYTKNEDGNTVDDNACADGCKQADGGICFGNAADCGVKIGDSLPKEDTTLDSKTTSPLDTSTSDVTKGAVNYTFVPSDTDGTAVTTITYADGTTKTVNMTTDELLSLEDNVQKNQKNADSLSSGFGAHYDECAGSVTACTSVDDNGNLVTKAPTTLPVEKDNPYTFGQTFNDNPSTEPVQKTPDGDPDKTVTTPEEYQKTIDSTKTDIPEQPGDNTPVSPDSNSDNGDLNGVNQHGVMNPYNLNPSEQGKVAGVQTSVSDPFDGLLLSPEAMHVAIIRGTSQEGVVAGAQTQIPYPYDAIMDSELLSPHDMKTVIITGNYLPNL